MCLASKDEDEIEEKTKHDNKTTQGQSLTFDSSDTSWKWAGNGREKEPDFYKKMNCSSAVN